MASARSSEYERYDIIVGFLAGYSFTVVASMQLQACAAIVKSNLGP